MMKNVGVCAGGRSAAPAARLASESEFEMTRTGQAASEFPEKLPLPPIPHLETMPWMNFDWETKAPRVDTLLPPSFVVPAIPKDPTFANNDIFNTKTAVGRDGS